MPLARTDISGSNTADIPNKTSENIRIQQTRRNGATKIPRSGIQAANGVVIHSIGTSCGRKHWAEGQTALRRSRRGRAILEDALFRVYY